MNPETAYIFNSLSFLFHGFLVFLMAAGFCLLEVGMVQTKNAATQCIKSLGLYSVAIILFWASGYNIMYGGDHEWGGHLGVWFADESAALNALGEYIGTGFDFSASAHWFFHMVFVGVGASIVSGALAERVKLISFFIFVAVFVGIIYPVQGAWVWSGGWLAELGFRDFGGATVVHAAGGWAALTGAVIIGARYGKYQTSGSIRPFLPSNVPMATLGVIFLWLGLLGFNGGSQLSMGSAADISKIAKIYVNTNMAGAAAVVTVLIGEYIRYRRMDVTVVINGALGGLVAITASPLAPNPALAGCIGAVGGLLVMGTLPLLDRYKIDDVVGAIPVHLVCGIWGTLAVALSHDGSNGKLHQLMIQFIGVVSIGFFVLLTSAFVWYILRITIGARVGHEVEYVGLDLHECGVKSYPEFTFVTKNPGMR